MLPGINTEAYLGFVLEAWDFLKKHGKNPLRDEVAEHFPYAAAHGYMFSTFKAGKMAALAIVGPAHGPVYNPTEFDPEGRLLFCYYALVRPNVRGPEGIKQLDIMLGHAVRTWPHCERLGYYRQGGERYRERDIFRRETCLLQAGPFDEAGTQL